MTTNDATPAATDETIELRAVSVAAPAAQERPRGHRAPRAPRSGRETARSAWAGVASRWEDVWPVAVGIVLGSSAAFAFLALAVVVWLDLAV